MTANTETTIRSGSRRATWISAAVIIAGLASAWGMFQWRALVVRRYRAELSRAEQDFKAGRLATAQQRLTVLEARWPGDAEVAFRLGICELARGRRDKALADLARVPPGSAFAAKAATVRGQQLMNTGRFAPAESILEAALLNAGADSFELMRVLRRLYQFEGRSSDVRRLLCQSWSRAPDPATLLKDLWALDKTSWATDVWADVLKRSDPDDDRVWLGQANLATVTARYREAGDWLAACLKRRPDDPAVWRGRLKLAQATGDVQGAWESLSHIPAASTDEGEILALRAWLAARRGDAEAERRALEHLVEHDPGRSSALERLATFASDGGRIGDAERFRRRKAEIDRATDRYRKIVFYQTNLAERAEELAALSTTLGRRFDAQAWTILRDRGGKVEGPIGVDPAKDGRDGSRAGRDGRTLADLMPGLRPVPGIASRPPAATAELRPAFADEAEAVGLRFRFDNGETALRLMPETMSGGVAVLDYDGDGWLDVYAVQGGPLDLKAPRPDGDHLFRNNGDGTFRDATVESGIASIVQSYGLGVAVGDYDNDGDPDLFLSRLRSYGLYRNRGDGTFEDATAMVGLEGIRDLPASAAFADLDSDGDLDLYVCHYTDFDPEHPVSCPTAGGGYLYCDPMKLIPAPDRVFRNDGGRFVDVTGPAGFVDPDGRSLGVVAADLDEDGKVDLFVTNDGTANYLFRNLGGFRFEETGHASGVAASANGGYRAGMGAACGDLDGNGLPDLVVTNFYGESSTLYQNLGRGLFNDRTADSGLGIATRYLLGFGTTFLDYDNDGRLDLMTVNGHVNDHRPQAPLAMPAQLLAGDGRGRLSDVSADAGPPWSVLRVGRGLAAGDLDNDGRIDAVILAQNEPIAYFHNRTAAGHFLTLKLEGTASSRDGVGARVTILSGGHRQVAHRFGGGSYQSASDPRLHFGIGGSTVVDSVEVRWPSGSTDRFTDLPAGTGYLLREGATSAAALKGFSRGDDAGNPRRAPDPS